MKFRDETSGGGPADPDTRGEIREYAYLPPLGPKTFTVTNLGTGIRLAITDHGRKRGERVSAAVRYAFYWAAECEPTVAASVGAAFARATLIASIDAPQVEDKEASTIVKDGKYLTGWFFCVGVAPNGEQTEPTEPIQVSLPGADDAVPGDVTHFLATEVGEVHDSTVYSVVYFTYRAPVPRGSFAGVQLYLKDYPTPGMMFQSSPFWFGGLQAGGQSGRLLLPVGRRQPTTTFTVSISGANLTFGGDIRQWAKAGDYFEYRGHMQEILSVSGSTAVLTGAWIGPYAVNDLDFWFVSKVRIYAVSVSRSGTRRADIESSPYVDVLLDGALSEPTLPDFFTASPFDNGVRLEWPQLPLGLQIKEYKLYRNITAGLTDYFDLDRNEDLFVRLLTTIQHDPNRTDTSGLTIPVLEYQDNDFTTYDREQNNYWTYYLVPSNIRNQESLSYLTDSCQLRLTKPSDTDPNVPSRSGGRNLLYNAMFYNAGAAGAVVDWTDINQDFVMVHDDALNGAGVGGPLPSTGGDPPTGGRRYYRGHTRWQSSLSGGAGSRATHQNGDEARFTPPGAGQASYVYQNIGAWNAASLSLKVVRKGGIFTFQSKIRKDATIDGVFAMYIEPYNNAATSAANTIAAKRYRSSADQILYTGVLFSDTPSPEILLYDADLSTDWKLYFATFVLDSALTTTHIRVNFGWRDGTTGNIFVKEAMLSEGEELFFWTPEMNVAAVHPGGNNPATGEIGDGGGGRGRIQEYP